MLNDLVWANIRAMKKLKFEYSNALLGNPLINWATISSSTRFLLLAVTIS
jgi:hypothetical protein